MKLFDRIHAFFNREVDSILKPLQTAIRRVEALGTKYEAEIVQIANRSDFITAEADKAKRVAAKLKELLS